MVESKIEDEVFFIVRECAHKPDVDYGNAGASTLFWHTHANGALPICYCIISNVFISSYSNQEYKLQTDLMQFPNG
jgi:hypothetical protein